MLSSPQELSEVLGILYDAAADPSLWGPFIERLARRTGATSAALVMHDFARAFCSVASSWELNPELNRLYEEHYHTLDVWAQRGSAHPEFVCHSRSICPLSELKTTEIYNELLVPSGINMQCSHFRKTGNRDCLGSAFTAIARARSSRN